MYVMESHKSMYGVVSKAIVFAVKGVEPVLPTPSNPLPNQNEEWYRGYLMKNKSVIVRRSLFHYIITW